MNNITIVKGQSGLGRTLPGADFISGLLFYTGSLPSGFDSNNRVKKIYSISDAEDLGVLDDFSDETKSTGKIVITNAGATGDEVTMMVDEWVGGIVGAGSQKGTVTLGSYTNASSDSIATVVTGLTAAINAGTATHGYTAAESISTTVTITARPGMGVYLNTGSPYTKTVTGTMAGTITQNVITGVASLLAIYHYHISEYFRMQPAGVLYLGFYAVAYTFTEIKTMQDYSGQTIRQLGVYINGHSFATADLTTIQGVINSTVTPQMLASVLVGGDLSGTTCSAMTTLAGLSDANVSVIAAQDGNGVGYDLFKAYTKSITCLGAALGTVSLAKVSEDIAWVGKFNISDGTENDILAFATGELYENISSTLLDTLDGFRYIFLRKFTGIVGSFWNDSHTSIAQSSDYAYIENNRTIQKAIVQAYAALLPDMNSPLELNDDGTLQDVTIAPMEGLANGATAQMVRDGELSDAKWTIDPAQNVLSTSKVIVNGQLLPIGVARAIQINIGFTTSIQ